MGRLSPEERAKLEKRHNELASRVEKAKQRRGVSRANLKQRVSDGIFQVVTQTLGTLVAAAIFYLFGAATGLLKGTQPATILSILVLLGVAILGILLFVWVWSHRRELKLMDISNGLAEDDIAQKLHNNQPLSRHELKLIQYGLVFLPDDETNCNPDNER